MYIVQLLWFDVGVNKVDSKIIISCVFFINYKQIWIGSLVYRISTLTLFSHHCLKKNSL